MRLTKSATKIMNIMTWNRPPRLWIINLYTILASKKQAQLLASLSIPSTINTMTLPVPKTTKIYKTKRRWTISWGNIIFKRTTVVATISLMANKTVESSRSCLNPLKPAWIQGYINIISIIVWGLLTSLDWFTYLFLLFYLLYNEKVR